MIDVPARVKDALREGNYKKNYIFNVLNDDGTTDFTIDNDTLVSESVKIDERMCTGNDLKFGLCEGSSLEFQYFDHPNITDRQIQAFIEVEYVDGNGDLDWYTIPMGFFDVNQCPMQFETGIRKVTAYNKLRSAYLDEKANAYLNDIFTGNIQSAYIQDVINALLGGYGIVPYEAKEQKLIRNPYVGTRSHGTVKLKQVYGEHIFNGTPYWDSEINITTSTDFSVKAVCSSGHATFSDSDNNYVQIRVPDYFDELDDSIYNCISDTVYDCFSNATATTLMNNLINYTTTQPDLEDQKKWAFGFRVVLDDDSEVYYGSTLTKKGIGIGTFEELSRITLHNVKAIYFTQFFYIYTEVTGEPYSVQNTLLTVAGNKIKQYPWSVAKPTDESQILTSTYEPFPDDVDFVPLYTEQDIIKIYELIGFDGIQTEIVDVPTLEDVTLRELQSAVYEVNCQYGQISRITNLFSGVTLNNSRLLPADTLYPDNALYPGGNSLRSDASMYQKLWTDSQGVQTFRYLIITYKTTENGQEVEKTLQRTVNADGTTDYYMSDNWLFKNLIWTAEDVGDYADAMVLKMQNVSWFPFEMWCAGLPYIETGDELEITNSEGTYTSYVLQRQLNGIQNLQDTFIDGELDIF